MKELKTIESVVRAALEKHEETRDDDMLLYLKVCNAFKRNVDMATFSEVMTRYKFLGLPNFESVGRTRRKLQANNPDLMGTARIQQLRAKREQTFKKYAKE